MRVHVVLKKRVRADPAAKKEILEQLRGCGMENVNEKRFLRYGILSGDVSPERIDELEATPGVESVSPDERKSAL